MTLIENYKAFGDATVVAWCVWPKKSWRVAAAYLRMCVGLVGSDGPGQQYAKHPRIKRSRYRILVTQVRGLDV